MTARAGLSLVSLTLAAGLVLTGCATFYEVPIDTPIQAKLDVTPFQRVHVVGFIGGGSEEVDANLETVRLIRSQLRTRSRLRVIDADPLPLEQVARQQLALDAAGDEASANGQPGTGMMALPPQVRDEKDLEAYEPLFANADYWKRIGEEFQQPLIVTGTVIFRPHQASGIVTREMEQFDQFGRRVVVPQRVFMERKGFILRPRFVFIDGRSGAVLYQESYREERLYPIQQNVPALSSFFEQMDALLPSFLNTLSTTRVRGSRVLLK
jgi:hypothetical protein